MNTSISFEGLGIHLKVRDIEKSREFYEQGLGLIPVFGYGSPDFRASLPQSIPSITEDGLPGAPEAYSGVTYELAVGAPLEIADGHIAVPDRAVFDESIPGPKVSAMVRVGSLVPLFKRGVTPHFPVRHYYWGTVEAAIKDPDGFVLVIIAPFSDDEVRLVSEFTDVEVVAATS